MAQEDLQVKPGLTISGRFLQTRFSGSSGPGGQHVNRTHTQVELIFDLPSCGAFTPRQKGLVVKALKSYADASGCIHIRCQETRSQTENIKRARGRLCALVKKALAPRKIRKVTKPSRASVERRLQRKQKRGAQKKDRSWRPDKD